MDIGYIKTTLQEYQLSKRVPHKLLTPLPATKSRDLTTSTREKELTDVYTHIQRDIKQIKDDVLNNLADGEAVDYDKIKVLFEKAETEIQEKKQDLLQQFMARPAVIPSSTFPTNSSATQRGIGRPINSLQPGLGGKKTSSARKSGKQGVLLPPPVSQHGIDVHKLKTIINPAGQDARLFASSLLKKKEIAAPPSSPSKRIRDKSCLRSRGKPITGSNISSTLAIADGGAHSQEITAPPPSSEDARKGILNLIERKMIPASSSLTIVPSPIRQQKVVLHAPGNKVSMKHEPRSQYGLALVKFDKTTLDQGLGSVPSAALLKSATEHNTSLRVLKQDMKCCFSEQMDLGTYQLTHSNTNPALQMNLADGGSSHKFVIQAGRALEDSQDFVHFKQYHCLTWGTVSKFLSKLEKLLLDYAIPIAFVDGRQLADMALYFEVGPKPTMKDLLMCVLNSNDVEAMICIPGRRYLAADGDDVAATQIQRIWRGHRQCQIFRDYRKKKYAASLIALTWIMKCKKTYMRKHLQQKNKICLSNAQARFKVFKERWPKLKTSKRVIIHLPSLGYPINIRQSLPDIATLQNRQLGRICDVKDPNVEVIYICPLEMDIELHDYYKRLMEIICKVSGQDYTDVSSRLKMVTPENLTKFQPHNLCLSSLLKYSEYLMTRLKNLIKGKEAYIVPGYVQYDDLIIADALDVPILGCEPEIAHLYSLKSGIHRIFESADVNRAPCEYDIYTQQQFEESSAKLVTQNLHIKRWLFKMDHYFDGRGSAYCDVTPFLSCYHHALKEAERYGDKWQERWAHQKVYNMVLKELPGILETYATPVDTTVYKNWREFLQAFLSQGGIIEACPPADSVTGITAHLLIEPDGHIEIQSVADQIHSVSPYKCWGHTLPQSSLDPHIVKECVLSIGNACKSRGVIGYMSIDFVTFINPESDAQEVWAVGINLGYSNSHAMIHLMTSLSNATLDISKNHLEVTVAKAPQRQSMYVSKRKRTQVAQKEVNQRQPRFAVVTPYLHHSNLSNITYNVFFQICRAHGIAYDDSMKTGTAFTLMSSLHRDTIGMITVAETLHDAVSMFALNMVTIHNDISTPNMTGTSNFQGALEDLRTILESLKINLQLNQEMYPTMDPRDRRRIKSAGAERECEKESRESQRVKLIRAQSAEEGPYVDENIPNDDLLEEFSNKLILERNGQKCLPTPSLATITDGDSHDGVENEGSGEQ